MKKGKWHIKYKGVFWYLTFRDNNHERHFSIASVQIGGPQIEFRIFIAMQRLSDSRYFDVLFRCSIINNFRYSRKTEVP
jgi:hypothetical protein